jgi:pimeloyl-ACP methyl ester carboxylesterase
MKYFADISFTVVKRFMISLFVVWCMSVLTNVSFAQPINTDRIVTLGGIKQFIHIETSDRSFPVLLFLHGGPGGSVMGSYHKWSNKLKDHFVVVQWDQRETGKTLELNASPTPLTVAQFQQDAHELVDTLRSMFNQKKIYIVGHSWGTVLGFYLAKNFPEKLHAYVAVGPMINQLESERIVLKLMIEKAKTGKKHELLKDLETIRIPFENGEQLYFHRKYLFEYMGSKRPLEKSYVLSWSKTWLTVYNDASKENLFETLPRLNCPVYFFAGRKDYQTNSSITQAYYTKVSASEKKLVWFEKSAHGIPTSEPDKFQDELIRIAESLKGR